MEQINNNNIQVVSTKNQSLGKIDFGNCKICSDQATGVHYGVASCKGCKGFFKRSLEKFQKYGCRNNKQCKILPKQKGKCKYCRWNLCLISGMSVENIRMGRIPIAIKEKTNNTYIPELETGITFRSYTKAYFLSTKYLLKLNNLHQFENIDPSNLFANNLFVDFYLNTSQENHLFILSTLRDKSYQLYREYSQEFDSHHEKALRLGKKSYEYTNEYVNMLREKDLVLILNHAKIITQLFKQLPGLDKICPEDQITLIKESFFTTLAIRTLKVLVDGEFYLMLDDYTHLTKEGLGHLLTVEVRDKVLDFEINLQSILVSSQELALLLPFFLTWNYPGIKEAEKLLEINEYYARSLFYEFGLTNRNQKFLEDFIKTIQSAPKMNELCRGISIEFDDFS